MKKKMEMLYLNGVTRLQNLAGKKVEGISPFIATAITIVVCVIIGILFKDTLVDIFTSFFGTFKTKLNGMW